MMPRMHADNQVPSGLFIGMQLREHLRIIEEQGLGVDVCEGMHNNVQHVRMTMAKFVGP